VEKKDPNISTHEMEQPGKPLESYRMEFQVWANDKTEEIRGKTISLNELKTKLQKSNDKI